MFETLSEMVMNLPKEFEDRDVFYHKVNKKYVGIDADTVYTNITYVGAALTALGMDYQDKIALISDNRPEWHICDLGMQLIGLINIPIYTTITPEDIGYIIKHSEAKILIISGKLLLKKIKNEIKDNKNIKYIVGLDIESDKEENILSYKDLLEMGKKEIEDKGKDYLQSLIDRVKKDTLASIIYTSGTTGTPKGVLLTHYNFMANAYACLERVNIQRRQINLSFLPLSHVYERCIAYVYLLGGASIAYAENIGTVGQNLQEMKPNVMVSVPRVFEKIYIKVIDNISRQSKLKQNIFYWAKKVGEKWAKIVLSKKKPSFFLNLQYKIAYKLVFSKINEKTGGRLLFTVSGGSALAKPLVYFFKACGIDLCEGYGLTETSPVIATNSNKFPNYWKPGTVGKPLSNVEVKIAEDGEILIKGDSVMQGYYKLPKETQEVFTEDGYLKTGDIGEIDEEGFLKITDRKKDMFKTSGGKYIIPQKIEGTLKQNKFISEFVVIGENRKYCAAIIVPDFNFLEEYAKKELEISFSNKEELVNHPKVIELYKKIIKAENMSLSRFETIKKFKLLPNEFTIESGEITPSLKVKRKFVEKKYKDIIEDMFPSDYNESEE